MPKVTNGVHMTKAEFMKEHTELVKTLKSPTKAGLRKEAKEQGEEVKKVRKGPQKRMNK